MDCHHRHTPSAAAEMAIVAATTGRSSSGGPVATDAGATVAAESATAGATVAPKQQQGLEPVSV
jgi:hypothetical protein